MRFSIFFQSSSQKVPIHYHRLALSLIKTCFEFSNKKLYESYYENSTKIKPFTFSIFFPNSQFESDNVLLNDKKELILNFSSYDVNIGVELYNGLLKYVHKKSGFFQYKDVTLFLKKIVLRREFSIDKKIIRLKTLSPIVIRKHRNEIEQKDSYLTIREHKLEILNSQLQINMQSVFSDFLPGIHQFKILEENLELKPVLVKMSEKNFILGNIGKFSIEAEIETLEFIYKAGLGAKRSFGFGMLEVVQ